MKKLFKAIRSDDFAEVRLILEKHPEALNEAATPPPKKDAGLSPLQVALKIGEFDLARYLIEQGADVNYIDPEGEGDVWRMPVLQDAIRAVFFAYEGIEANIEAAEKATSIVRDLLERGADPNVLSWRTVVQFDERSLKQDKDAFGTCIFCAFQFINSTAGRNFERRDIVAEKLTYLLDLLIEHGADVEAWASRPASCHHRADETARKCFIDDFVPVPDKTVEVIHRGTRSIPVGNREIELKKGDRRETLTIHGDIDTHAGMRAFMQEYFRKNGRLQSGGLSGHV